MRFLTLARRQVLAQLVLNTIPYYVMQSTLLPEGVYDRVDSMIRNFLCGSKSNKRKCHLVHWDEVIKPKDYGGLGI